MEALGSEAGGFYEVAAPPPRFREPSLRPRSIRTIYP